MRKAERESESERERERERERKREQEQGAHVALLPHCSRDRQGERSSLTNQREQQSLRTLGGQINIPPAEETGTRRSFLRITDREIDTHRDG